MPMTPTRTPMAPSAYLALTHIGGHALSEVTMPAPGLVALTRWAIVLDGKRYGLALTPDELGGWQLWHIQSGCMVMQFPPMNTFSVFEAMALYLNYGSNFHMPLADLNWLATDGLKALSNHLKR